MRIKSNRRSLPIWKLQSKGKSCKNNWSSNAVPNNFVLQILTFKAGPDTKFPGCTQDRTSGT